MHLSPDVFQRRLREAIHPEPLKQWCTRTGINLSSLNSAFQRKTIPGGELLAQISLATGRSIDWLVGLSDVSGMAIRFDDGAEDRPWGEASRGGKAVAESAFETDGIDPETLCQIIAAIEDFLASRGLVVPPDAKARYVTYLYQHFTERGQRGVDVYVREFLSAASP